jgi:hypothetical protein
MTSADTRRAARKRNFVSWHRASPGFCGVCERLRFASAFFHDLLQVLLSSRGGRPALLQFRAPQVQMRTSSRTSRYLRLPDVERCEMAGRAKSVTADEQTDATGQNVIKFWRSPRSFGNSSPLAVNTNRPQAPFFLICSSCDRNAMP